MDLETLLYWITLALIGLGFWFLDRHRERRAQRRVAEAHEIGTHIPVSLSPRIDPERCIGTAACAMACPEKSILEIVGGRAILAHAAHCVGHGACYQACPVDAIDLVIGSEQRGVHIPHIQPNFETNRRGIYIAGELGGMGLIANAIQQGTEAADYIDQDLADDPDAVTDYADVAVIGSGPAGIAAALRLHQLGRRIAWFDRYGIGGAVNTYPRQKIVMTRPFHLPGWRPIRSRELSKEQLADTFRRATDDAGITPKIAEVTDITGTNNAFQIVAANSTPTAARRVLLALGRRGNPRRLNVPGEDLPFVTYVYRDGWQYEGQRVFVVGGGDSAVESALTAVRDGADRVMLCYRGERITRARAANRQRLERAVDAGEVELLLSANVTRLEPDGTVYIDQSGQQRTVSADIVIIQIGGEPPTEFLNRLGIEMDIKHGETIAGPRR
ncbi:MAG: 4Fe-4S dicluster domain-containing protein [Candidatus Dadabacteria bacterium]|nr:MAG: 4Fe-4S dicluster domain-containing protein [Candidatus Dadabacteria bacterium]